MWKQTLGLCVALAFLIAVPAGAIAQTAAAAYDTNLVVNGDAESDFGAPDAAAPVKPKGWDVTGDVSVVQYGAKGEFPDKSNPGTGLGALNFFAGGKAAVSTATQSVSIAALASDIDANLVTYDVSAQLGGYGSLEDNAAATVTFLDEGGKTLASATIGPVGGAERAFYTAFKREQASGAVPKGARTAVVLLTFKRAGDAGDGYNHGFADNVALVLSKAK